MSKPSDLLLPHIPFLRRYGRALTGSQDRGDKYVAATLEAILTEVDQDEIRMRPKVALFRAFHDVWQRLAPPAIPSGKNDVDEERLSVKRTLAAMPRWDRQVYLLSRLEKFSTSDIAAILRTKQEGVVARLEQAVEAIAEVPAAQILIVEDDPVISLGNAQLVRDMGHNVAGLATNRTEALALNASTSPDLLLVDIRLSDGDDGIDTVQEIVRSSSTPVIFVTGHPEDLLTGKKREPAFVVTKPFDPEVLKAAISQALTFRLPELSATAEAR